jgi:uncharacterized protein (TIGR03083 family)
VDVSGASGPERARSRTEATPDAALGELGDVVDDHDDLDELDVELAELLALDPLARDDVVPAPPADLRTEVLLAALEERPAGAPLPSAPRQAAPLDAFRTTVAELRAVLDVLDPAAWDAGTSTVHGTVRDLVAHLAGVEEVMAAQVGAGRPRASDVDHVASAAAMAAAIVGGSPTELAARWHDGAERLAALAEAAGPDAPVQANDIPTDVAGMLVLRTFEVWAHTEDVCRATGRPAPRLDAARLALMSRRLLDVLPLAMAVQGVPRPGHTARLVLTGAGGGCYDRPLAPDDVVGVPDVELVVDVVDLCRLAARRARPEDVDLAIDGDEELASAVLVAVGAFARD